MDTKKHQKINPLLLYCVLFITVVLVNLLFLNLVRNEVKTITLLKNELKELEKDQKIIASSQQISQSYASEIELISQVFPNEETIPTFIGELETLLKSLSDDYSFKFNAITPLKEGDLLFLPMTITLKTEYERLLSLFTELERLPYMTHIYSVSTKTPSGFTKTSEVTLGLKIYVQNPFATQ